MRKLILSIIPGTDRRYFKAVMDILQIQRLLGLAYADMVDRFDLPMAIMKEYLGGSFSQSPSRK